jgi:hypothetical protein
MSPLACLFCSLCKPALLLEGFLAFFASGSASGGQISKVDIFSQYETYAYRSISAFFSSFISLFAAHMQIQQLSSGYAIAGRTARVA